MACPDENDAEDGLIHQGIMFLPDPQAPEVQMVPEFVTAEVRRQNVLDKNLWQSSWKMNLNAGSWYLF